jgi:hypothetical protein
MIFVTKADGSKQPFDKNKVIRTCLRMRASQEAARLVADKIESKLYEGISTKEILRMIFFYLKNYKPELKNMIDLRESISLLRPKPDFEDFVCLLLKEYGYETSPPQLIQGKCVEHEVDVVARKGNETIFVEVKHHFQHHTYTGVGVFLEAWSTFLDLLDGYEQHKNNFKFNKILVACNTKFSDHAMQYARCKNIGYIGWSTSEKCFTDHEKCLADMVENKRFYPITILKDLDGRTEEKLADNGIILLKQLIETDLKDLQRKTGIDNKRLGFLKQKALEVMKKY